MCSCGEQTCGYEHPLAPCLKGSTADILSQLEFVRYHWSRDATIRKIQEKEIERLLVVVQELNERVYALSPYND